jgi:uncharacterized protein YbjT (DUF2867 family)
MDGVEAVVDLTNVVTVSHRRATTFFGAVTRNLVAAERVAEVRHHVVLSIAGVDRFPGGYYRAKVDQERVGAAACRQAAITHTVARVAQFHDFAAITAATARLGPLVLVPPLHLRPVHLDDVADHLLDLLEHPVGGHAPELSGPQPEELDDMVRRFTALQSRTTRMVRLPLPGAYGRANAARVLAAPGARQGARTFALWLTEQGLTEQGLGEQRDGLDES